MATCNARVTLTAMGVLTIMKCMRDCVVRNKLYVFF
jgi:hypothetical protein